MSGSSSGGGQSGKVEYSAYLEAVHLDWLGTGIGGDAMTTNIAEAMEIAHASSPFSGVTVYDPDVDTSAMIIDLALLSVLVQGLDETADWNAFSTSVAAQVDTNILDDTTLVAEITANDAIIDDRITTDILPRFQAGMQDINAVVSSAFVIGKAVIEGFAQRDKDKFGSDLRLSSYKQRNDMIMQGTKDVIGMLVSKLEYHKILVHYSTEVRRIKNLMKSEELSQQLEIDEKDVVWDMGVYQYGANVMAGITGAAATTRGNQPSTLQKALGGVLSGVAAGATVGGGPGAIVGGILGLASSFL